MEGVSGCKLAVPIESPITAYSNENTGFGYHAGADRRGKEDFRQHTLVMIVLAAIAPMITLFAVVVVSVVIVRIILV